MTQYIVKKGTDKADDLESAGNMEGMVFSDETLANTYHGILADSTVIQTDSSES